MQDEDDKETLKDPTQYGYPAFTIIFVGLLLKPLGQGSSVLGRSKDYWERQCLYEDIDL